jgi:hypothetical protein
VRRIYEVVNRYQLDRGSPILCVDSAITHQLLQSIGDPGKFARILFNCVLGGDGRTHYPRALVFCMHVDGSHYLTLLLVPAAKSLLVFDSLGTGAATKTLIAKLAVAFKLRPDGSVQPRKTVQQRETPRSHCAVHQIFIAIGACHRILPIYVSDSQSIVSTCALLNGAYILVGKE